MKKIGTGIFLLFSLYFSATSQVNLSQGLLAYYPFNGNANDLSGNAINGSINNVTLTTDRAGSSNNAYYFSSKNSFIELPYSNLYSFTPSGALTISIWILPDQGSSWPAQAVIVKSPPNPDYLASQLNHGTYLLNYKATGGYGGKHVLNETTTLNNTTCWYNIVQTYDDGRWNIYVNGVLESSDSSQTRFILQDGFSKIVFGNNEESDGDYYKGKMDDIRIYNRVVTSDEIAALYNENNPCRTNNCSNWLLTPSYLSSVSVGDLDVTGNQLTVEALVMSTSNINPNLDWGKIVSKHTGPENVNYSLMANTCEITTTNGYINTPLVCAPVNDKLYHVAMVYDGSILKFYRNGFLMSSVPWTGNLTNNDLLTTIACGPNNPGSNYQQLGFINEVRIWNVARTQSQIRAYINTSIPNPTTQIGLLGYYTFDNLLNKQGNASFNGTINGAATINNSIADCTVKIDSCEIPTSASIIINKYTPALAFDICKNELTVEDATEFKVGDTVLLIQMNGAVIDSSNSAAFGNISDYKNSGNYEFNFISQINGNVISLKNKVIRKYDFGNAAIQIIRVPYFDDYTVTSNLTCLPWNGKTGGVLVLNVKNSLTLQADIDVTAKGFSSPGPITNSDRPCNENQFFYDNPGQGGQKGNGIAQTSASKNFGKGKLSNAGGGGNSDNGGGGGGSNIGAGGNGGKQWQGCTPDLATGNGLGGVALLNNATVNKAFMGGSGGMGHSNDGIGHFPAGNGGGIAMIFAGTLVGNGNKISANGEDAFNCTFGTGCTEGMSGGGGGGSIFINVSIISSACAIEAKGGKGADNHYNDPVTFPGTRLGTGGGGGGGLIAFQQAAVNPLLSTSVSGGLNGVNTAHGNDPHGATAGSNGISLTSFTTVWSNTAFKKNIDSIRFQPVNAGCNTYTFNGSGFTNTTPVTSWQWLFGDGGTAITQNTSHSFAPPASYSVKLIGRDINGCKDSFTVIVNTTLLPLINNYNIKQPTCLVGTGEITITSPISPNLQYSINGTAYQASSVFSGVAPGTYNLTVRNTTSTCVSPANVVVINTQPLPPVTPTLSVTQPTCIITTGTIETTAPGGSQFEYSLNGGAYQLSPSFSTLVPGNYQVTVRNATTGCISSPANTIINQIPQPPVSPVTGAIVQPTCTNPTGSFQITAPLGNNFQYSVDGVNFQTLPNFSNLQPGTYNLVSSNLNTGCISLPTALTVNSLPTPPALPVITITQQPSCTTPNGSFLITSPAGMNFEYSRGNNIYQSSSLFNNLDTGLYAVTVRDRLNGCVSAPASILISPDISTPGTFFIPNAFTPNNDGLNDCFGVKNWGFISQFKLMIYNRWGEEVFYTSNPNQCWDGTFKGIAAAPGTYVFYIKAVTLCGVVERKGNLVLIR